jgi:hypothetical protein
MRRRSKLTVRWGFLALLLCVLSCLGMGAGGASSRMERARMLAGLSPEDRVITQQILEVDYHRVDQSLGEREEVDFLLTPALLVQEAVSDGIVLTYPEE